MKEKKIVFELKFVSDFSGWHNMQIQVYNNKTKEPSSPHNARKKCNDV